MDRDDLLQKCDRLKTLLRYLKLNPRKEPYQSIEFNFVSEALTKIGRDLIKHDRIHGGGMREQSGTDKTPS